MISNSAVSIDGTFAGVNTSFILTSQSSYAIRMFKAFVRLTVMISISLVMGQAEAFCSVSTGFADCIGATLGEKTRILTFLTDACLVITTFRVALAAS